MTLIHSFKKVMLLACIFIFLISCKKNDLVIEDEMKAFVETLTSETQSDGGVVLTGKLNLKENFTEYGFIIATDTSTKDSVTKFIYSLDFPVTERFKKVIPYGLTPGQTYFYKAYAKQANTIYVGETKKFQFIKAKDIIISSITTEGVHLGDIVSIIGKNFLPKLTNFTVITNSNGHMVISTPIESMSSDTVLKYIIPHQIISPKFEMTIQDGYRSFPPINFTFAAPIIKSTTPTIINIGDTITIDGDHFERDLKYAKANVGVYDAKVVSTDRKQMKIIYPASTTAEKITITAQNQIVSTGNFQFKVPSIIQKPVSLMYGDVLTMYGRNINLGIPGSFLLSSFLAAPDVITADYAKLTIPYFAAPHRKAEYEFSYANKTFTYKDITITDKWYWAHMLPFTPGTYRDVFTLNSEIYIFSYSSAAYDQQKALYKFNPIDYSWTKYTIPQTVSAATAVNGKIIFSTNTQELFEFKNNTTTKISNIPNYLGNTDMYGNKGKIYTLLGVGGSNVNMYFYIYTEATNTWEKKSLPVQNFGTNSSSFFLNDNFYVIDWSSQLWQFNENDNTWTKKASFPLASTSSWKNMIAYNGKAYCFASDLTTQIERIFVYNPATNSWSDNGTTTGKIRSSQVSFYLNGQFYVGGNSQIANPYKTDLIQTEAY